MPPFASGHWGVADPNDWGELWSLGLNAPFLVQNHWVKTVFPRENVGALRENRFTHLLVAIWK